MGAPVSTIHICSGVKLNSKYEHTIYFSDKTAQQEYFAQKVVKAFDGYTFLRRSWPLKVQATLEEARHWNYLYFQNGYGKKTYYFFINSVEYVNDGTVELQLEMDVIQTHYFDATLHKCFVERQHVENDAIGANLVEENLDTGELQTNDSISLTFSNMAIMIMSTINPGVKSAAAIVNALPSMYNGVFSGVKIWAVHESRWAEWGAQMETLETDLGQTEAIQNMWMYPASLVTLGGEATWTDDLVNPVEEAVANKPYTVPGRYGNDNMNAVSYYPRNNKLLTYPYHFMVVSNNQGGEAVLRFERFTDPDILTFAMSGALSPDGGVSLYPRNYDNTPINRMHGLVLSGFPTCAWDSDQYKLWLVQNQNQHELQGKIATAKIVAGTVTGTVGLFTGGASKGYNMALSGVEQIYGKIAEAKDRDIIPPEARGNFTTSLNFANGGMGFTFYWKGLTREYAAMLDDYFDLYGYAIKRVKVPNICARAHWTYIKTIGCHISGDIYNEDILKMESVFDHGVTFWTDGEEIGNYALDNRALS